MEDRPKKTGILRIVMIGICSVILATALAYGLFCAVQTAEANRLAEETARMYLIPAEEDAERGVSAESASGGVSAESASDGDGTESASDGDGTESASDGDGAESAADGDGAVCQDSTDNRNSTSGSGTDGGETFAVDWEGIRETGSDVVAWIRIPAIPDISYPVVHYTDNDYYLRRSWRGEYLVSGSIMEDWHCAPDFSDFHTILYGHNMASGTMFGQLKKFRDEAFYRSNDDRVIIYTPEKTLIYTIFSVHVVDPSDASVYVVGDFSGDDASRFAEGLSGMSEYDTGVRADGDSRILTLSTCSGTGSTKRLVVHAKLSGTETAPA